MRGSPAQKATDLASQRDADLGVPGTWVQLAAVDRRTGTLCGDCAVRVITDQPATVEVGVWCGLVP
jgi:hypothetical protein